MLFLLLFFSFSKRGSSHYESFLSFIVLAPFGFTEGSTFKFDIETQSQSRLILFLINEATARKTSESKVYELCYSSKNISFITPINFTTSQPGRIFTWNGTVTEKNIYYPIFLNCLSNHTKYSVNYSYHNTEYLVDYRNANLSLILLGYGCLNGLLTTAWLLNILFHRSFFIPLQFVLAILPSLRSIKCILEAYLWEQKKITDLIPVWFECFIDFTSALYSLLFCTSTSLVFSGWCIYRSSYSHEEMLKIVASSGIFILGLYIGIHTTTMRAALLSVILNISGFLWFMTINITNFVTFIRLLDTSVSHDRMAKRLNLIRGFIVSTTICVAIGVVIFSSSAAVESPEKTQTIIFESSVIIIEFIELFFFYLRKEYEGEISDHEEQAGLSPYVLECPNQKVLCLLQKFEAES